MGLFDVLSRFAGEGGEDGGNGPASDGDADGAVRRADPDLADFRDRAETLVDRSPIDLDYSVDSLARLDETVAGQGGTPAARVACAGYLGEVLVRAFDAEWTREDDWTVAVDLGDETTTIAVLDAAEMTLSGEPVFAEIAARVERQVGDRTRESASGGDGADADGDPTPVASAEAGEESADGAGDREESRTGADDDPDETGATRPIPPDSPDGDANGDATDDANGEPEQDGAAAATGTPSPGNADGSADTTTADGATAADPPAAPEAADDGASGTDDGSPRADETGPATDQSDPESGDRAAPDAERETSADPDEPDRADLRPEDPGDGSGSASVDDRGEPDAVTGEAGVPSAEQSAERRGVPADAPVADAPAGSDGSTDPGTLAAKLSVDRPDYELDRTPASLARLDALLADAEDGDAPPIERLAAYYGDALVGHLGGEWARFDDEGGVVTLSGPAGRMAVDPERVAEACLDGASFARHVDAVADWLGRNPPTGRADFDVVDPSGFRERIAGRESADAIAELVDAAEAFADGRPALDYAPASLAALDDLADSELAWRVLPGVRVGEGDDGRWLATAAVADAGAYFAAVLVRHLDATWLPDAGPRLAVEGPEGNAAVDALAVATACVRGEATFAGRYERLRERVGADAPPAEPRD
ncbi:hypothetical protein [Halomicrobium salinisoli]|uniref:hypothetical protein n=1 Tax=Halomicrobium salinisoli TaxID=2878391 RepID=UPI001CF08C01|nr:hypothetical protein [Halomicrobium salinisoli]